MKSVWRKSSVRRGQTWQQSSVRGFPKAGDGARALEIRMRLPAKQPNGCQLQGAKDWAPSRTSGTSRSSIAEAMECLRIPRSSFARQRAKKHLVCGAGRSGRGTGAVSLLLGRLQHTGREPQEHRRRSGSHTSSFAFPERGPALPGAGPWLPVPAARSMTGQALP